MNFLALDTSTEQLHLGVCKGEAVLTRVCPGAAQASAQIIPLCLALLAEAGLREMNHQDRAGLPGQDWLALQHALNEEVPLTPTLRLCAQWPQETRQALQTQLRHVLHYHCGVQTLRTRQVLMDLQAL